MGGKGEGRVPFRKKEGRDSNTKGARHSIIFKEWRDSKMYVFAPPTRAHTSSPPF